MLVSGAVLGGDHLVASPVAVAIAPISMSILSVAPSSFDGGHVMTSPVTDGMPQCLAVNESGAVSGGNRLVASPAGASEPPESLLCVHLPSAVAIQRVTPWAKTSCLTCLRCLGAFLGVSHPLPGTLALLLGAVFGGNRLLASPVNAAV